MKFHLLSLNSGNLQNLEELRNSLFDEEHTGRSLSAIVPENVSTVPKTAH